jgi:hypothetical protein
MKTLSFAAAVGSIDRVFEDNGVSSCREAICLDIHEFVKGFWSREHVTEGCESWTAIKDAVWGVSSKPFSCAYLYSSEALGHSESYHMGWRVATEMIRRYYYTNHFEPKDGAATRLGPVLGGGGEHCMLEFYHVLCCVVGKYLCNTNVTTLELGYLSKSMEEASERARKRYAKVQGFDFFSECSIRTNIEVASGFSQRLLDAFLISVDLYRGVFSESTSDTTKTIVRNESRFEFRKDNKHLIVPFTLHSQSIVDGAMKLGRGLKSPTPPSSREGTPGKSKGGFPALECIVENPYSTYKFEAGVAPYAPKEACQFTMAAIRMK